MATEAVAWGMEEEVWVWEVAMVEVVVMGSQQEVEAMEEEWCTEEVWVEVPGRW